MIAATDSYVSLDLETTGLNPKTDRIMEVGAVKVIGGEITGHYTTLVNPGRKLTEMASAITGITDCELLGAPGAETVIPELRSFIGDLPLLGQNILFDFSFVRRAAVNQRLTFDKQGIDTLKLARRFLAELGSRSLSALCAYYGIEHHAHRALNDAEATHQLYQKLTEYFFSEETEPFFRPRTLVYQVKREGPVTKPQKERLYKLLEKHKLVIDVDIEGMTRNEASRITDKILFEYGRDI